MLTVTSVITYNLQGLFQLFFHICTLIFDLELIALEKRKNVGIRPFFRAKSPARGVFFRRITVLTEEQDRNNPLKASNSPNMSLETSGFIQANLGIIVIVIDMIKLTFTSFKKSLVVVNQN